MQGVTVKRLPEGVSNAGTAVLRIHYSSDPTFTHEKLTWLRSKYTSEARWRREMEIEALALEGELLYPQFNRERNLCKPFDVSDPEYWTIWMALDPHPRTAHAMAWEAFSARHDRVVCGELWPEFGTPNGPQDGVRWTTRDYAETIKMLESDSEWKPSPFKWARGKKLRIARRYMDTFGAAANSDEGEDYFETYRKLGIELKINLAFQPALKGHDNLAKAQDAIARSLMASQQGPPMMRVFDDCYELTDEFENVRYPEGTPERPSDEKVLTYRKHVIDCLHYIETARPGFILPRAHRNTFVPINPEVGY
jgi:hypothetical protein